MVSFRRRSWRLDRCRPFIECRIPLVVFAADKTVEVLESAATCRPRVERTCRTRLPYRDFMALTELRGGIPVEFQCKSEWRLGVRQHRVVARRAGRNFGDATHSDRVMIAPGE